MDAVACFLDADEGLSLLILDGVAVRRRPFPTALDQAVPVQQRAFVSQSTCDASGEPRRIEALVEGVWLELTDALELEILEMAAQGDRTIDQLSEELKEVTDGEVAASDVVERLRNLYRLRLVSFA